jgi:hypothetical protein
MVFFSTMRQMGITEFVVNKVITASRHIPSLTYLLINLSFDSMHNGLLRIKKNV